MHGASRVFEEVDIHGTERVLAEAKRAQVQRLLYVGTLSGYPLAQLPDDAVVDENTPFDQSGLLGSYARAKCAAESMVVAANTRGDLETVVVRLGLVCGAGTSVLPPHVGLRVGQNRSLMFGDGSVPLPLTFIDNAVDALILGAETPGIAGESFNIVDDEVLTQGEYLKLLRESTGDKLQVIRLPTLAYYAIAALSEIAAKVRGKEPATNRYRVRARMRRVRWNCSKAAQHLKWYPRVSLRDGLTRTFRGEPMTPVRS
jgi:nucleoside-diphosphate-sugar epimerase